MCGVLFVETRVPLQKCFQYTEDLLNSYFVRVNKDLNMEEFVLDKRH